MERTYKVAGILMNMDTWGLLKTRARPYEVEYTDKPELVVSSAKAWADGYVSHHPAAAFREYTAAGVCFYNALLDFDALLIHSSAVIMDGKAYLFSADAGTGKSTHTALYRRVFGDDRARILNDDKPVLRLEDGEFWAYGTPWSGKSDMNLNLRVPIGGICLLKRGEKNTIRKMEPSKVLFALLGQTVRPKDPAKMSKLLELMDELLKKVNIWEMYCNMDPEAAIVSYETMSGIRKEETR